MMKFVATIVAALAATVFAGECGSYDACDKCKADTACLFCSTDSGITGLCVPSATGCESPSEQVGTCAVPKTCATCGEGLIYQLTYADKLQAKCVPEDDCKPVAAPASTVKCIAGVDCGTLPAEYSTEGTLKYNADDAKCFGKSCTDCKKDTKTCKWLAKDDTLTKAPKAGCVTEGFFTEEELKTMTEPEVCPKEGAASNVAKSLLAAGVAVAAAFAF